MTGNFVLAQAVPPQLSPEQQEILRQRQQQERESFRRFQLELERFRTSDKQIKVPADPQKKKPLSSGPGRKCVTINSIVILSEVNLSRSEKDSLVSDFLGLCLTLGDLNQLLEVVGNYYIERGYSSSRPYLPAQNMSGGVLKIKVAIGTIEDIVFAQNDKGEKDGSSAEIFTAFPFLRGSLLNLRVLEQGLDQLNRLQSNNARMHFYPGREPGTTRVIISNPSPKKPWAASLSLDNSGSEAVDYLNYSAILSYDSLLKLGDFWSYSIQRNARDIGDNFSRSESLQFVQPFGDFTASAFVTNFSYLSTVKGQTSNFDNSGDSQTRNLGLKWLLSRDQSGKTQLSYDNKYRKSENYINDVRIITSSRMVSSHSLGLSHSRTVGSGSLHVSMSHLRGELSSLENTPLENQDQDPALDFAKTSLNIGYGLGFLLGEQRLSWNFSSQGQLSDDILFSGEEIGIGGQYSVRGFRKQSLAGDKGFYLRNEISWSLPSLDENQANHSLFLAYDLGSVSLNAEELEHRGGQLEGIAIGWRNYMQLLQLSLTYSQSTRWPRHFKREEAVWFSVAVSF